MMDEKQSGQSSTIAHLGETIKQPYDNKIETQQTRILKMFEYKPQLSTFEGRAKGIVHLAGRIKELRDKGYKILTTWTNEDDALGISHTIAC